MKKLTKAEKKEYLENPNHCPRCKSGNINAGTVDVDGSVGVGRVDCADCDFSLVDWYCYN